MRFFALIFIGLAACPAAWSRDLPRYADILSDPPPIRARAAGGNTAVQAARSRVLATQRAVKEQLRARGIRITGR